MKAALLNSIRATVRSVRDFAFPAMCPLCGGPPVVSDELSVVGFCQHCRDEICIPIPFSCDICGAPVGQYSDTSRGCIECGIGSHAFGRVVRLGLYEHLLRKACIRGKNKNREPMIAACTRALVEEQADLLMSLEPEVLVPIPQHWSNRLVQTHNAAEVMANVLAIMLDLKADNRLLTRSRRTAPQKRAGSHAEREFNQKGSFRVPRPDHVTGRRVLLVDDIVTTGATANAAAKEMQKAGATVVGIAVLARVISTPTTHGAH